MTAQEGEGGGGGELCQVWPSCCEQEQREQGREVSVQIKCLVLEGTAQDSRHRHTNS